MLDEDVTDDIERRLFQGSEVSILVAIVPVEASILHLQIANSSERRTKRYQETMDGRYMFASV